jgi:putative exosortase-associated protein (TIGR04073 family)
MTHLTKVFTALMVLALISSTLWATEVEPEGSMGRKLQRGFLNIALSPIEISNELAKETKNDGMPPSWLTGAGRGAIYMLGRALVGAYEIVTFAVPCPAGYKPVIQPEFPWQNLPSSDKK